MAADLFDDELIELISTVPEGLFQFEIGIQSTNETTLQAVDRKTDMIKAADNIRKLISAGNINIHLDLIAGLPHEDMQSFRKSFNDVYSLKPHQLQLGFLKLLKGTKIRNEAELNGYIFRSSPPYEILYNSHISCDELLELKAVEEMVERYYNSAKFCRSSDYLIGEFFPDSYEFFKSLADYYDGKGLLYRHTALREQYDILYGFAALRLDKASLDIFSDLLKFDYLKSDNTRNLPQCIEKAGDKKFREQCFAFLMNGMNVQKYLENYIGQPAKQIIKKIHMELFRFDNSSPEKIMIFDYSSKNPRCATAVAANPDIIKYRNIFKKMNVLECTCNAPARYVVGFHLGDIFTPEKHLAPSGTINPRNHVKDSTLAGAVGAN
jgi:hypothetical protein